MFKIRTTPRINNTEMAMILVATKLRPDTMVDNANKLSRYSDSVHFTGVRLNIPFEFMDGSAKCMIQLTYYKNTGGYWMLAPTKQEFFITVGEFKHTMPASEIIKNLYSYSRQNLATDIPFNPSDESFLEYLTGVESTIVKYTLTAEQTRIAQVEQSRVDAENKVAHELRMKDYPVRLSHITDLANIPIEHISQFIAELPELLEMLRTAKRQEQSSMEQSFPQIVFTPNDKGAPELTDEQ